MLYTFVFKLDSARAKKGMEKTIFPWVDKSVLFLVFGYVNADNELVGDIYPFKKFPWKKVPGSVVWSQEEAIVTWISLHQNKEKLQLEEETREQLRSYFRKLSTEWWIIQEGRKSNMPHIDSDSSDSDIRNFVAIGKPVQTELQKRHTIRQQRSPLIALKVEQPKKERDEMVSNSEEYYENGYPAVRTKKY